MSRLKVKKPKLKNKKKTYSFIFVFLLVVALFIGLSALPNILLKNETTKQEEIVENVDNEQIENEVIENEQIEGNIFDISSLSHELFDGENAFIVVNDNIPFFTEDEITDVSFEMYGDLDELGRCTIAFASVGKDLMPTDERESISSIYPTGWKYNGKSNNNKYDFVSAKYIYNRCHLIGFQLTGENANKYNLITGTRFLNIDGMIAFENMIADAVKENDIHVMYRVTPIFEGNNLVAEGLLLEGYSVEDKGETIEFCVFSLNVQPGVVINYATGENWAAE